MHGWVGAGVVGTPVIESFQRDCLGGRSHGLYADQDRYHESPSTCRLAVSS